MQIAIYMSVGLLAGLIGGWLGIGGGALLVPILILVFKVDTKIAIGTSLAVIVPIAVAAAVRHSFLANVDWKIVLPMAVGGLIGGVIGAQILEKTSADLAKRALALFWVYSAIRLWMTTLAPR